MKFYTVYTSPAYPHEARLVPQGFSWLVFILGSFGLILQKSWIYGLIILSLCCVFSVWMHPTLPIILLVHFILGCFAFSLQRKELTLSGWHFKTVIAAPNKQSALLRFLDFSSDLTHLDLKRNTIHESKVI